MRRLRRDCCCVKELLSEILPGKYGRKALRPQGVATRWTEVSALDVLETEWPDEQRVQAKRSKNQDRDSQEFLLTDRATSFIGCLLRRQIRSGEPECKRLMCIAITYSIHFFLLGNQAINLTPVAFIGRQFIQLV